MSDNTNVYNVEAILGHRRRNGRDEYLIKWQNTWEPESSLDEGSLKIAKAYRNGQKELQQAQKPQHRKLRLKRKRRQENPESDDDCISHAGDSYMSDGTYHDQSVDNNSGAEKMPVTPSPKRPRRVCYANTTSEQTRKTNEELSSDDNASYEEIIVKKRGARRKTIFEDSDDSDTASDNENSTNDEAKLPPLPLSTPPLPNLSSSPKKLKTTSIQCSSTIDALTRKRLPHPSRSPLVCFTDSDGDRYCYALEILYRMTIENHVAGQRLTFLQPPYFYGPMSEDLQDQIACRFGRDALKIKHSRNYHRYYERFVLGLGRHDLYCCPVCYNEASRSRGSWIEVDDDDDGEEKSDEEYGEDCFSFDDDPMTILGKMGSSVASSFCFLKVKGVRMHMQDAHSVDLGDLKGNDLFKRFMIRSPDGLLQHYTSDMWSYWRDGNNSNLFRNLVELLEGNEDKNSASIQSDFCTSFPNRARKIWEKVCG